MLIDILTWLALVPALFVGAAAWSVAKDAYSGR